MRRNEYLPEGVCPLFPENQPLSVLREAMEDQTVLEGLTIRCDARRDLTVRFGGYEGVIPRADGDIALLSRVGKPTCFTVTGIETDGGGRPHFTLSRRAAQEQAIAYLLEHGAPGAVLPARVTHLESFGAFVDLGCGFTSRFAPGSAVPGIVRGIKEYGIFIELAPNLTGLAEWRGDVSPGDAVSVYIKSIRPDTRKIKLQIIQNLGPAREPADIRYFITDGTIDGWAY